LDSTITLREDLELQNYIPNLTRIYGEENLGNATPTNMRLDGIDKHLRLVESHEKLQVARLRHHHAGTSN